MTIMVKVTKCKSGPFEHAESMSLSPEIRVYIGNIIYYLIQLSSPFPRGLDVDLERSTNFLILMLLMHIDRLGLFYHM